MSALNPRTTHYEFLGPPGAAAISLGVPFITYALYFGCSEHAGGCPPPLALAVLKDRVTAALADPAWWAALWDTEAALIYLAWYAFCVAAWALLPGDTVAGTTLRTGGKVQYKINAFSTCLLALGIACGIILRSGPAAFTFLYAKWLGLASAALLMAVAQAVYVYAASFRSGKLLALGGNSGNHIYDWYIGRELNPALGRLDIKSFNELRPGLILWVLLNLSFACEQAVRRGGALFHITDSMWLVLAFQAWYVLDGLYNEPALFTTMDITSDGFGFMLAVGDLLFVPFVYSLQGRYLVWSQVELGWVRAVGVVAVNLAGYYVFRTANKEKNDFRNGLNPKNLKFITTARGSKLLVSGWWGASRHPNYFGDLIMGLAWCLPTGFATPITYFYFAYFAVLLVHRQRRDDEACAKKYGKDWAVYTELVPYRIVPYVY
ncbi:hypothetical protein HYPSUDRAFT_213257 [Hypholoma sublateritium FD-334 SS-4]|uniref:Delta(14)-sterol reductase ERG24 n=1 Tax=Hypholoma sublateritium (strain FD-334 SS-4) TaxID=945553 RepID=A0A0D2MQF0_HYPSF|nr:hypothetical protein HYPSUDRAFT_213257 [Hypholoma sublateritium FD-334 SS-4]